LLLALFSTLGTFFNITASMIVLGAFGIVADRC
jgi:hypothetical protein